MLPVMLSVHAEFKTYRNLGALSLKPKIWFKPRYEYTLVETNRYARPESHTPLG